MMSTTTPLSQKFLLFLIGIFLGVGIQLALQLRNGTIFNWISPFYTDKSLQHSAITIQEEPAQHLSIPTIQNTNPTTQTPLSCLSEECISEAINFKSDAWYADFEQRVACLKASAEACKSSTYMSLEDADYLILQNILFDMDSLTFYPNKESDIHLIQSMFPYLTAMKAPNDLEGIVGWETPQSWMILPPKSNMSSLVSTAFLLLHSFLYPQSLPPKRDVLFPTIEKENRDFPEGLFPVIAKAFGRIVSPVFKAEMATEGSIFHFVTLVLVGNFHREGQQIVQHPFDSDYVRGAVYKDFSKPRSFYSGRSSSIARALYLTKLPGESSERRINRSALRYAQRKLRGKMNLETGEISSIAMNKLVKEMTRTDILIAVSGSPLYLSVFMLPQSAVLEILPKFEKTAKFHQFAISLNLFYYSHYQITASMNDKSDEYEAFVDDYALWIYLQDLVNMVLHHKFHI